MSLRIEDYGRFMPRIVRELGLDWRLVERSILVFLLFDTDPSGKGSNHIVNAALRLGLKPPRIQTPPSPRDVGEDLVRLSSIYSFVGGLSEREFLGLLKAGRVTRWVRERGFHGYFYMGGSEGFTKGSRWPQVEDRLTESLSTLSPGALAESLCFLKSIIEEEGSSVRPIIYPLSAGADRLRVRRLCSPSSEVFRALLRTGLYRVCGSRARLEYCVPFEAIPPIMRSVEALGSPG